MNKVAYAYPDRKVLFVPSNSAMVLVYFKRFLKIKGEQFMPLPVLRDNGLQYYEIVTKKTKTFYSTSKRNGVVVCNRQKW
jgi:hypothetical protein